LYLLDQGEPVAVWGVALGKNPGQKQQRGDMKTPTGLFRIDEIDDASAWTHDFKDGKGVIKGAYGPFFLSLDTEALSKGQWGGIGIHGTHDPASIGTRASEGCIRLRNDDLKVLKAYAFVGMQVKIEE
jgi:lipoprotein-anchoring transpeptidase ErfK/SrfK